MLKKSNSNKFVPAPFEALIEAKRDGGEFNHDELRYIIDSILDEELSGEQLSALIMAIYFKGFSAQETALFAQELMISGKMIDLSDLTKPKVARYSTGGVGDKTALALPALVAACGVTMPGLIGDDEGFILSSIDKLSVIPGFKTDLSKKEIIDQLKTVGFVLAKQHEEITPVDRILYNLRERTATIPSLPLIAASVISKKLAEGAESIIIDV